MNCINSNEIIGRYIYSKQHYRPSNNTVKYAAFMPPQNKRLSVFIISGLDENQIWSIGENLRNSSLKGRADIFEDSVYKSELDIEKDDKIQRHAEIINWPDDDSAIMLKAIELANSSTLKIK